MNITRVEGVRISGIIQSRVLGDCIGRRVRRIVHGAPLLHNSIILIIFLLLVDFVSIFKVFGTVVAAPGRSRDHKPYKFLLASLVRCSRRDGRRFYRW